MLSNYITRPCSLQIVDCRLPIADLRSQWFDKETIYNLKSAI